MNKTQSKTLTLLIIILLCASCFIELSKFIKAQSEPKLFTVSKYGASFSLPVDGETISINGNITTKLLPPSKLMEEGGQQWAITFDRKLSKNSITIPIKKSDINLYYQPPLTEEFNQLDCEIWTPTHVKLLDGREFFRPIDMCGGYVAYHVSKRDNEFKTGKLFNLLIPRISDNNNVTVYGSYNKDVAETGKLTITIPQDFLDSAVYPITVDPDFGYTTAGAASTNGAGTRTEKWGCQYTPVSSGTLVNITAYFYADVEGDWTTAVYSDSGNTPNALLENKTCHAGAVTTAWNTATGYNIAVTAATNYWLTFSMSGLYCEFHYDSESTYRSRVNTDALPLSDPFGAGTDTTNQRFSIYGTYEALVYPYVQQVSNIDSVADIGTHSNFTAQQAGPDNINDTLTEADSGGSSTNTTLLNDGFETSSNVSIPNWDGNGATSWTNDGGILSGTSTLEGWAATAHSGSNFAGTGATGDGNLTTDSLDMSTATAIYVSFWYAADDTESSDYSFTYFNGNSYVTQTPDLGLVANEDTWTYVNVRITDSQYFTSNFQLQFIAAADSGEAVYVDDVLIIREVTTPNYKLALEEQFTAIPTGYTDRYLCIFAGPYSDAETLSVQGWNLGNSSWTTITALTTNQWNNVSVASWVSATNTNFTIQFIDGTPTSDTSQSNWQIDATYLYFYNISGPQNYPIALSNSQSYTFNAGVKWGSIVGLTQAFSATWAIGSIQGVIVGLTQAFSSSFSSSVVWASKIGLSQTLDTSWNAIAKWALNVGLSNVISGSWNTLTAWASNILLTQVLSVGYSVVIEVTQIQNYIIDLSSSMDLTWNIIFQWIANINVSSSLSSAWNSLIVWTSNIALTQAISSSWDTFISWFSNMNLSYSFSSIWNVIAGFSLISSLTQTLGISLDTFSSWGSTINLSHFISTSWDTLLLWASNVNLSQVFSSNWNNLITWATSVSISYNLSYIWSGLMGIVSQVELSQNIGVGLEILENLGLKIELSQSFSLSLNSLMSWLANVNLINLISSSWVVIINWFTNLNLIQSLSTSWNVFSSQGLFVGNSLGLGFAFNFDSIVTVMHDFFVDLSVPIYLGWSVLSVWIGDLTLISDTANAGLALGVLGFMLGTTAICLVFIIKRPHREDK